MSCCMKHQSETEIEVLAQPNNNYTTSEELLKPASNVDQDFECFFPAPKGQIPDNCTTFPRLLEQITKKYPKRRFLGTREYLQDEMRGQYQWYSYLDIYRMTALLAEGIKAYGIKRGDRVGIISVNRTEWSVVDFACSVLGVVLVPIYDTQSLNDIDHVISDAGIEIIFASLDRIERVSNYIKKVIVFDERLDDRIILQKYGKQFCTQFPFASKPAEEFDMLDKEAGIFDTGLCKADWQKYSQRNQFNRNFVKVDKQQNKFFGYLPKFQSTDSIFKGVKNFPSDCIVKSFCQLINEGYEILNYSPDANIFELQQWNSTLIQMDYETTQPDDIMTLVYTSGTTGRPKGVVLSQKNVAWTSYFMAQKRVIQEADPKNAWGQIMTDRQEYALSYLPLAHIYMRVLQGVCINKGAALGVWQGNTTGLLEDVKTLRITMFFLVPRIVQKIVEGIITKVQHVGCFKQTILMNSFKARQQYLTKLKEEQYVLQQKIFKGLAPHQQLLYELNKDSCKLKRFDFKCTTNLAFKTFPGLLGGRCRLFVTGSAPMSQKHSDFILSYFNLHLFEGYGMSETTAHGCVQSIHTNSFGFIGEALETTTQVKLRSIPEMDYYVNDAKTLRVLGKMETVRFPRGELMIKGPSIFNGYWKNDEKTAEVFEDGWFKTGDVAEFDPITQQVKIIDRKTGIFKLSQGEFISISQIEDAISKCRFVEQVFVYADRYQNFPLAIVVPSLPYIQSHYSDINLENVHCNPTIIKDMHDAIGKACKNANLRGFEIPKVCIMELVPWDAENGLLTPALKVKRPACQQRYGLMLEKIYDRLQSVEQVTDQLRTEISIEVHKQVSILRNYSGIIPSVGK